MSRWNTSLPQTFFDTPRTPPSTKTIPAAGGESRFFPLRPLSTRIPAGPAQDFGQDTNRNPGRTKVGLPARTPTTSPRKDARKARKRPKKGPERPRRARPAGPHKAQRKGQRRPPKAHQKPTATSRRRRSQPATKEPQERPGKAHGRPQTGPAVQGHRPHRRGQGKAQERPEKGHHQRPNPCRLWLPCRRVSNG